MTRTIGPLVTADELEDLLEARPEVRLLDVRTPGEYEAVHIRGAYNVPLDTLGEHAREIQAHVDAPVVLICQTGSRARRAEEALNTAGMPHLQILDGGMNGWLAADKDVERGRSRLSLERQVRIAAGSLAATAALLALVMNPVFAIVPLIVGGGLVFAGVMDTCAMAMVLSRLPYNRPTACDIGAMVHALKTGRAPEAKGASAAGAAPARACAT